MKEIKIIETGSKQIGVRVTMEVYQELQKLAKTHKTSLQEIIRYILQEEIKNYK
jgi:hypothetical protein